MYRSRLALFIVAFSVIVTMVSSFIPSEVTATYPDIMGCEQSCLVAAGGWPFPYLVDYPGISVVGSVWLLGAGSEDKIWLYPLVATFSFWLVVLLIFVFLYHGIKRRKNTT